MFSCFSFRIYVKDGYGTRLLDSYCGPDEGEIFITSNQNIFVEVRGMNKYDTFTARYAILNGSVDKGKEFQKITQTAVINIVFQELDVSYASQNTLSKVTLFSVKVIEPVLSTRYLKMSDTELG